MVDIVILSGFCNDTATFNYTSNNIISFPHRLLGPYKIAHRIRTAGYTVQVIDFVQFIDTELLIKLIKKFIGPQTILAASTTHLIGLVDKISTDPVCQKIISVFDFFKKNKKLLGGFNSVKWKEALKADFVIHGYAENDIINFMNTHSNNGVSKKIIDQWNITSCNFRWHPTDHIIPGETIPMEMGRGCIFKCKFCKFENIGKKRGTYIRNIDLIKEELLENFYLKNITNYQIIDDTFNDDVYKLDQWAKIASDLPFKIKFATHIRADLLDKNKGTASLLRESGLKACSVGLESLHPKASSVIGKSWSGKRAAEFIPTLLETEWKDINLSANFIVGLPNEPFRSVLKTYNWVSKQKMSAQFFKLALNPNFKNSQTASIFEKESEKYGITFHNSIWSHAHGNEIDAGKLTDYLNKKISMLSPLNGWDSLHMLTYGYDFDHIMSVAKKSFLEDNDLSIRVQKFINMYVEKLEQQEL